jgi:hypothetical protein
MRCYQMVILSLPLTIGLCVVTQTPVASAPITALPMPSIYAPPPPLTPTVHEVIASCYGRRFAGRPTTSGERFDPHQLTAASITLPIGSVVKVENPKNGRSVKVRINDCGPYVRGRSLDLSFGAAHRIGIDRQGVARLRVIPINIPRHADADRCCE